jgi:hypothetical protein
MDNKKLGARRLNPFNLESRGLVPASGQESRFVRRDSARFLQVVVYIGLVARLNQMAQGEPGEVPQRKREHKLVETHG